MENLQAPGKVLVKICTDLANTNPNLAGYGPMFKLKHGFHVLIFMDQSAVGSINQTEAGFMTGLIEVIRLHAEACVSRKCTITNSTMYGLKQTGRHPHRVKRTAPLAV